jgi:surface antigen
VAGEDNQEKKSAVQKTKETVQKAQETVQKAQAAANAAKTSVSAAQSAVSALGNPYVLAGIGIILAIILILVVVIPPIQTYGRNEAADGCYGIGENKDSGGSSGLKHDPDAKVNSHNVGVYLTTTNFGGPFGNKPFTKEMAAGVIGNFGQESGFNSELVQYGSGLNKEMSNDEMIALGDDNYGKAIGFAQWDGVRRKKLAEFAKSKNGHWSDLGIQMDYLKHELETGEGDNLVAGGFTAPGKSVDDLTLIFMERFERAGHPAMENRYKFAQEFMKEFTGGGATTSGSSSSSGKGASCRSGSSSAADMSSVVALAKSMAWDRNKQDESAKIPVAPSDPDGVQNVKPEYRDAKKKAEEKGGKDTFSYGGESLYASCDRFVATVLKNTVDPNVPWGATAEQQHYFEGSSDWQELPQKASELQPGDVMVVGGATGHIVLFIGDHDGKPHVAQASNQMEVGSMYPYEWFFNDDLVDKLGRKYKAFRYVGPNSGALKGAAQDAKGK